ncbi:MAG: hydrogenase maturation protease [Chloroflexi bacterium]|nr:hydrogenase maturation protease [Chloroflexota bacterium]
MSNLLWKTNLTQKTASLRASNPQFRTAIVGIGNEFGGDDAAGIAAARALIPLLAHREQVVVIDAGPAPENQTGALRVFRPDLVLLVDAAQMNEEPGTIRWLDWQDTTGLSASTHTLPLHMLARFLTAEIDCQVVLLGIQPARNLFDEPLSLVVQQALEDLVQTLAGELSA